MLSSPPRESSTRPKPREDWIWRYIGEIASTPAEQRTRTIQVSSEMCQAFSEIERFEGWLMSGASDKVGYKQLKIKALAVSGVAGVRSSQWTSSALMATMRSPS